ncbi:MAG: methyl viologen-reducing hydrogenase [Candidatus Latescibacteria bacterium]|nr:methyl viologen-reducing hydrogenase [Candidatus Latescibacterota bacterium]
MTNQEEDAVAESKPKVRLNTDWLSVCGGCHVSIVDLHEKILAVLGEVEIQHCPVLTDIKDYPPADVGILTGAIRNEHDREVAHKMRESCKLLISFGTCAVYGGIPGAGIVHSREEILDRAFVHNPTTDTQLPPDHRIPPLEKLVTPLDEVIDVDLYLPGCPPHPAFIFDALLALIEGRPPKAKDESICARCERTMVKTGVDHLKSNHEGVPDAETCLLSQGYICLGSVTLDRCLAPCPNNGVMCTGCAGPTMQILTEPNRDIRTEIADRMVRLTALDREQVVATIERGAKTHYSYAMASRMIGKKPTFLLEKWIAEVEEENQT